MSLIPTGKAIYEKDVFGDQAVRVIITNPQQSKNIPTDIILSNDDILTGSTAGAQVGELTTENGVGPFVYTIIDDPDNKFQIVGDELQLLNDVDYDIKQTHNVTIKVTDNNNNQFVKTFLIQVIELPEYQNTKSIYFDGEFNRLTTSYHPTMESAFSISFWIKRIDTSGTMVIYAANGTSTSIASTGICLYFDGNNGNRINFRINGASGGARIQWIVDSINEWMHICITKNDTELASGIKLYKNSVQITNDVVLDNYTSPAEASQPVMIGSWYNGNNAFYGNIDEFAIFDKELSALEVAELYNNGEAIDYKSLTYQGNLKQWLRMGDNDTTTTLTDNSLNGNNALAINIDPLSEYVDDVGTV
jgi:hypothetical protein